MTHRTLLDIRGLRTYFYTEAGVDKGSWQFGRDPVSTSSPVGVRPVAEPERRTPLTGDGEPEDRQMRNERKLPKTKV